MSGWKLDEKYEISKAEAKKNCFSYVKKWEHKLLEHSRNLQRVIKSQSKIECKNENVILLRDWCHKIQKEDKFGWIFRIDNELGKIIVKKKEYS